MSRGRESDVALPGCAAPFRGDRGTRLRVQRASDSGVVRGNGGIAVRLGRGLSEFGDGKVGGGGTKCERSCMDLGAPSQERVEGGGGGPTKRDVR